MDPIELTGALLGVICVWLVIRRNIWNFPVGIAMVVLYAWVFYQAKLYSDALLQVYYIGIQIYGWSHWQESRNRQGEVVVAWLSPRSAGMHAFIIALGILVLGGFMSTQTDAALPWWDASTTVMSVFAQLLLSRRRIESWLLWIAVDVISIFVYWHRELYFTMGLYSLFLIMAVIGLVGWLAAARRLRSRESNS